MRFTLYRSTEGTAVGYYARFCPIKSHNTRCDFEGGNGTLFVTKPYKAARHLSAQTTFYYEAGQTPSARMYVPDTSDDTIGHTSLVVTLIGHLIPLQ